MPQADKCQNGVFSVQKVAAKVTKDQICDGTISKNKCYKEYNWYGQYMLFSQMMQHSHYAALLEVQL